MTRLAPTSVLRVKQLLPSTTNTPTHLTDYLEVYPEMANSVRHDSINSAAQLN